MADVIKILQEMRILEAFGASVAIVVFAGVAITLMMAIRRRE